MIFIESMSELIYACPSVGPCIHVIKGNVELIVPSIKTANLLPVQIFDIASASSKRLMT